jgi:hypothetical protein
MPLAQLQPIIGTLTWATMDPPLSTNDSDSHPPDTLDMAALTATASFDLTALTTALGMIQATAVAARHHAATVEEVDR